MCIARALLLLAFVIPALALAGGQAAAQSSPAPQGSATEDPAQEAEGGEAPRR